MNAPAKPRAGEFVVRVTKPDTNDTEAEWMVFTKDRGINRYVKPTDVPSAVRAFMDRRRWCFFHALIDDNGKIIFGRVAGDQSW